MNHNQTASASVHARRAGVAASIGGPLLFLGAVASSFVSAQQPDGTVTNLFLFGFYTTTFTIGAVLLAYTLLALQELLRSSGETPPRSLRIGTRISLVGFVLLGMFGVIVAATGLATGAPAEASFFAFGLGFLLTVIGHASLAAGLRRAGILHRLWIAPLVAASGALIALVTPDIWHDLGLLTLSAAWTTLGVRLLARTHHGHAPPQSSSRSAATT